MSFRYRILPLLLILSTIAGCDARSTGGQITPPAAVAAPTTDALLPSPTHSKPLPTATTLPSSTPTTLPSTPTMLPPTPTPAPYEECTPLPTPSSTTQPTQTPIVQTAPAEILTIETDVATIVTGLQALDFDSFVDESYRQLLLRRPESITALGLSTAWGLRDNRLDDRSDTFLRETQQLEIEILALLRAYDRAELTPERQMTYDIYEWHLADQVDGHPYLYHSYPVHYFVGSYQDELVRLFVEYHTIADEEDAEDYVARLDQVDEQVAQILDALSRSESLGVILPSFLISWTLPGLKSLAQGSATLSPVYTSLRDKLEANVAIDDAQKQAFLEAAQASIVESVQPAFQSLVAYFEGVLPRATLGGGMWELPDGEAYYEYLLRRETSTDLSADEIHEMGLAEVARIQREMRQVFESLGYPPDEDLGTLMDRAMNAGGVFQVGSQQGKDTVIAHYEALLSEVDERLAPVVDIHPRAGLSVVGEDTFSGGGFYVPASLDGSRPGAFHTGVGGTYVSRFAMPTTAYHEGIPGHHFQMAIAQELDLPLLRNDLFFNGYSEGWALYSERLAWELGLYDDDPYGNVGRLQLELLRAVRMVVDTGIHAKRWTRQEAKSYMMEALGDPAGRWAQEVERYMISPAQAIGYKLGMLEILDMRQRAQDALGDDFDLIEFHHVVLAGGGMPLELLERKVGDWIASETAP